MVVTSLIRLTEILLCGTSHTLDIRCMGGQLGVALPTKGRNRQ
jgi:hypothetical protein